MRDSILNEIPSGCLPGRSYSLSEGDKVPADARLIAVNRLAVNNAPLTGEAESKPMTCHPFDGDLMESPNIVFAGTLVVSGSGSAVVFATGMATEFRQDRPSDKRCGARAQFPTERDNLCYADNSRHRPQHGHILFWCGDFYWTWLLA